MADQKNTAKDDADNGASNAPTDAPTLPSSKEKAENAQADVDRLHAESQQ